MRSMFMTLSVALVAFAFVASPVLAGESCCAGKKAATTQPCEGKKCPAGEKADKGNCEACKAKKA